MSQTNYQQYARIGSGPDRSACGFLNRMPTDVAGMTRVLDDEGEMFFKDDRPLGGLVLGALVLLATGAIGATPTTHARFAGTYASRSKDDATSGHSMDVSLGLDGTATVTEDAGNGIVTHFGHWVEADSQVKVSFDPVEGRPAEPPMTLRAEHDGLRAVSWNHATWGKTSPPVVKSRSRVKQRLTDKRSAE
jgi:hypothetical protein